MPAEHELHAALFRAPTALEEVPVEQDVQPAVPLAYVPDTHVAEQEEDPAIEYVPALQARHVAMFDAPVDLE